MDAVVIMGVTVANAIIGYLTESGAEKTIESLTGFSRPTAEVMRDGTVRTIPAEEVVIGDLLVLKPGSYISADCRLVGSTRLSIDESALTGESMPVFKDEIPLTGGGIPLADRLNMAYTGTLVTGGEGLALVVTTGKYTEIGQLQILLEGTSAPQTPIERRLGQIGDQLVLLCGAICGVVFGIGVFRGYGMIQMLRTAVSLAAAAVPEGLPAAATINFALGIQKMRGHHVLIRRLQAVETLGSIQTICLDKTGTITWNKMTVAEIRAGGQALRVENGEFLTNGNQAEPLTYEEVRRLMEVCSLCNESEIDGREKQEGYVLRGTPTENALVDVAISAGIDVAALRENHPLLKVTHRAENRLFMSTLHETVGDGKLFAVKGSPPEVLSMAAYYMKDGERAPLTEEVRISIQTENEGMAGEALRVLAVAYREYDDGEEAVEDEELTWLGLIGMMDPIREGVGELIETLHGAGIDTVMITGDQSPTAYAVARTLHISQHEPLEILDSIELASVNSDLLRALAEKVHVYSRVSPAHKLKIVQALQSAGKVVAMTGDGINDGPALKAADIGIAMGRSGTDVARQVADVVLQRDNLETLIIAIQDGRTTYNNIKKSVHFFLSTNLSEILVMFGALSAGIGFPLNVMQLLWINIISDIFPGLALSMEPAEPDTMKQPPRDPQEPLFSARDYKRMAFESAVISAASLGAYGYGLARYGMGARSASLAFQSLTFAQLLHALSCRSEHRRVFDKGGPEPNNYLRLAVGGSIALQLLTMIIPGLRRFLGLTPLSLLDAIIIGVSSLAPLAINEATKQQLRLEQ